MEQQQQKLQDIIEYEQQVTEFLLQYPTRHDLTVRQGHVFLKMSAHDFYELQTIVKRAQEKRKKVLARYHEAREASGRSKSLRATHLKKDIEWEFI